MNRALEMRAAFDRSFAEAPHAEAVSELDYLGIRLGADPYAIRLTDITGLYADRRITRLSSTDPAFVGIAGLRGAVVPVYALGAFLGYAPGEAWRWLLLMGGASLALAFDTFDGHLRAQQAALASHASSGNSRIFVHEAVHVAGVVRPIVQVGDLFHAIEQATKRLGRHEES